ncbi:MAG: pyridoxamine 5'-phosphate oxidase family protein [Ignavibacteriales bacterium]|nr:pyridoxamine 5'-phosphate oxidase family protein [Ignavibacteriales bacterium]
MRISFAHEKYSDEELTESIRGILSQSELCSIATVKDKNTSYIHTAYFAFTDSLKLYFLSDPSTQHCVNIKKNPSVAVAIADNHQPWQEPKRGLQFLGTCKLAQGREKLSAQLSYVERFVSYKDWYSLLTKKDLLEFKSKFFVVDVHWVRLFDEPRFGEEVYITVVPNRKK